MEVKVASIKDVPAGEMIGIDNSGQKIVVANVNGSYYAIGDVCTHRGCKLSEGTLKGDQVRCPCHGSIFDVKTGAVVKGLAKNPEKSFKVRVDGNSIMVAI
jgi:3-phenylpropionate/trans-cinnamate dioxygenase ferredoxin component